MAGGASVRLDLVGRMRANRPGEACFARKNRALIQLYTQNGPVTTRSFGECRNSLWRDQIEIG